MPNYNTPPKSCQVVWNGSFLTPVIKLWNDVKLAQAKPDLCNYIRNGSYDDVFKATLDEFGLFLCIQKEVHNGVLLIHVSFSISDLRVLREVSEKHGCTLKLLMEEVTQACFGYDVLLIEQGFSTSVANPFLHDEKDPSSYVYHWFYKNIHESDNDH